MIADIPMERTTMFDPDKRIEKKGNSQRIGELD